MATMNSTTAALRFPTATSGRVWPVISTCTWGTQRSAWSRTSAPAASPISTGHTPPCSMPGRIRLVKLAASMMPAAKPSAASRARSEGFRQASTSSAPTRLRTAMTTPPANPCQTGWSPAMRRMMSSTVDPPASLSGSAQELLHHPAEALRELGDETVPAAGEDLQPGPRDPGRQDFRVLRRDQDVPVAGHDQGGRLYPRQAAVTVEAQDGRPLPPVRNRGRWPTAAPT